MTTIKHLGRKNQAFRYPWAALQFALGYKQTWQNAIVLDAMQHLYGFMDLPLWKQALQEMDTNVLQPMNHDPNQPILVGNMANTTLGKFLYTAVRSLKPQIIIETGVSHGISTWLILNALEKNDVGALYSIDLPQHDTNPHYNITSPQTGWVVPDSLRHRWHLILGPVQKHLPQLLQNLGQIDCFFHDSEHTYENMRFEYETVWPYLRDGGMIISDDIWKNFAFHEFSKREQKRAVTFRKGGSICKINTSSNYG